VWYVLDRTGDARRNIVYWDEFDTALALVLRLNDGTTPAEVFRELFALSNEHRMVTSRLMFATMFWLTGTIDFSVVSLIGNASILLLCVLLVVSARTPPRRLRMAALLALLIFQLEHYENFLWSGSSIDHFQVVLLAGAAIIAVSRGTPGAVLLGGILATLATFTLAHGTVVWPVGAAMLGRTRNRRGLAIWGALAAVAIAGFLAGFQLNRGQAFATLSVEGAAAVVAYWLAMMGALPALGSTTAAPWLGALLLGLLAGLACRGAIRREPVAYPLAVYAVAAMALIAAGRAAEAKGVVFSRYYVLGAVAWALALFMALDRYSHPRRPLRPLVFMLPLLVAFNLAANRLFASRADAWLECRDRAVLRFKQHGVDGRGPFTLHPAPEHSTALLKEAERLGVYRMGAVCLPRSFPDAQPSARIDYFVDEMTVNARAASIAGWAAIRGAESKRGQLHLVLRSGDRMHVYTTVTVTRPDVAEATQQPGWKLSGFRFARLRERLPTGEFEVGFLVNHGRKSEYIMTAHRLILVGDGKALLATGE
jgi:hypothetical protein